MWESELRAAMGRANVWTPSCWWSSQPTPRLPSFSHRSKTDVDRFRKEEIARAQAPLEALTNKARALDTLTAYRNAFFQAFVFFHARKISMPPPAVAIGQFLALAVGASQNKSRAELHLNALSYVYRLNDWNSEPLASGCVRDPVHASISIYSTAKKQSARFGVG